MTHRHSLLALGALSCALAGPGCRDAPCVDTAVHVSRPPEAPVVRFRDVAAERGVLFPQCLGDLDQVTIMPMMAGGAGFLDFDGDGSLDILLLALGRCALYRNDGRGHFTEVTGRVLPIAGKDWMGCAAGDWDNDGRVDLLLTGYRCLALYRNLGGRFEDVTARSGLKADQWTTSAAFADFDGDGDLDLYVGAYVNFGPESTQRCPIGVDAQGSVVTGACGPERYKAQQGRLYRNDGRGAFQDMTGRAGLEKASGKTLGVAVSDFDRDGLADLYLANDRVAGDLFRNQGGFRFQNMGSVSGTAYNRDGEAQAGMGVDWGDFDGDGWPDLFVATYEREPKSLYRNDGRGFFHDVSFAAGLAPAEPYVAFGARFLDADNDGWLDLFVANGHVLGPVERTDSMRSLPQPLLFFRNNGAGVFQDLSRQAGDAFLRPIVGRGAAFGDFDNDGRCDIVVANLNGEPLLLRNETEPAGHWLRVRLVGSKSNRHGIGAVVTLKAGGRQQVREVAPSSSYLSTNDARLLFGLGGATAVDELVVRWPGGGVSRLKPQGLHREVVVRETPAEGLASVASP